MVLVIHGIRMPCVVDAWHQWRMASETPGILMPHSGRTFPVRGRWVRQDLIALLSGPAVSEDLGSGREGFTSGCPGGGGSGRPSLSCPPDAGTWVSPSGLLKYLCCEAMHASGVRLRTLFVLVKWLAAHVNTNVHTTNSFALRSCNVTCRNAHSMCRHPTGVLRHL